MKLLLTGATGAAGLEILRAALSDNTITQVTVLSRRPIPAQIPASPKAHVIIHKDFLSYPPTVIDQIADHDACIWALGKSTRGMSEADYTKMTHDYTLEAAKAINTSGHWSAQKPFRFVFMSGGGTDSKEKSRILFARVKGKTENDLFSMASNGSFVAQSLRPSYFKPVEPEDSMQTRGGESAIERVALGALSWLVPSISIHVKDLARASLEIAKGKYGDEKIYENAALKKIGKEVEGRDEL